MLTIIIPGREEYDEVHNEFIQTKDTTLVLEHSLVSLAKWEMKWKLPFISQSYEKTKEQEIDYIRCMTITQNVDPNVYQLLTFENIKQVRDYIADPMTATVIKDTSKVIPGGRSESITNEVIYYWMTAANIPFECQKWHLNRLLTLIRICNIKNNPPKKMSKNEALKYQAGLNAARRKKH